MSNPEQEFDPKFEQGVKRLFWLAVLAIFCQLPFVIIYFVNLSRHAHYEFFPVILVAFGWLAWNRYSTELLVENGRNWIAWMLLLLGTAATFAAVAFMSSWMAYFAFLCVAGTALSLVRDRESFGSLASLWILLAVLWQPPYSSKLTSDIILTSSMQRLSTKYVSIFLDWLWVPHVNQGTVISIRGLEMGVEEACSGIQSLFLYIAIAALCGVFFRRGVLHSFCLIASAFGWALVTNTLRIIVIALAHLMFQLDLTHGFLHSVLGYVLMMFGILLIASCDRLLGCLLPYQPAMVAVPAVRLPVPGWSVIAGSGRLFAAGLILCLLAQLIDLGALTANRKTIDFFSKDSIVRVDKSWLPTEIGGWQLEEYRREERSLVSDLGQQSDIWVYVRGENRVSVSFDQVFPGWHELTRCYEGRGWQCASRGLFGYGQIEGGSGVRAELVNDVEGTLLFLMVGQSGEQLAAPGEWDLVSSLYHRIKNRLSPRLRASVFEAEAYQIQAFSTSADENELQILLNEALRRVQKQLLSGEIP